MNSTETRKLNKVSSKLHNHEYIIRCITNRNSSLILTLEKGNYFYWVKLYRDGNTEEKYCFEHLINSLFCFKDMLDNNNSLKYNEVNRL